MAKYAHENLHVLSGNPRELDLLAAGTQQCPHCSDFGVRNRTVELDGGHHVVEFPCGRKYVRKPDEKVASA